MKTKKDDEKKQLESFMKHFDFLTSERFSKSQHHNWICLLMERLQDSQGGLALQCFIILGDYILEIVKQSRSDEIKGMDLQISSMLEDNEQFEEFQNEDMSKTKEQMNGKPIGEYGPTGVKTKKEQVEASQNKEQMNDNPIYEYEPTAMKPKKEQFEAFQNEDMSKAKEQMNEKPI
eukprot:307650_1